MGAPQVSRPAGTPARALPPGLRDLGVHAVAVLPWPGPQTGWYAGVLVGEGCGVGLGPGAVAFASCLTRHRRLHGDAESAAECAHATLDEHMARRHAGASSGGPEADTAPA